MTTSANTPDLPRKRRISDNDNDSKEDWPEGLTFFDEDVVFIRKNKANPIKKNSVTVQVRKVNRLIRLKVNVLDAEATLTYIDGRKWAPNTKSGYLQALASVLSVYPDLQEQYRFYSDESVKRRKIITKAADDSLLTPKEKKWPKWSEIDQLYIMGTCDYDRALMAFYTLLPPRRIADIASLVYGEAHGCNYITLDYSKVVYAVYKTVKSHGIVEIALPEKLAALLKELEPEEGKCIWPSTKNASRRLSKAFKTVTDIHVTANILRHSFLSDVLSIPQSTGYKKKLGSMMGHGIGSQQAYIRLDLAPAPNAKKMTLDPPKKAERQTTEP